MRPTTAAPVKKSYQPRSPSTPQPQQAKSSGEGKVRPKFNLSVKIGDEFHNITGLFERVSKKGEIYYNSFNKETKESYLVFVNRNKKTGEQIGYTLSYSDVPGSKAVVLADLVPNKAGTSHFGANKNNASEVYFLNESKPK